jgi:hypothetical protein
MKKEGGEEVSYHCSRENPIDVEKPKSHKFHI